MLFQWKALENEHIDEGDGIQNEWMRCVVCVCVFASVALIWNGISFHKIIVKRMDDAPAAYNCTVDLNGIYSIQNTRVALHIASILSLDALYVCVQAAHINA